MKKPLGWLIVLTSMSFTTNAQEVVAGRMNELFLRTNLATGLQDPWEVTYGPDDSLWVTEASAGRTSGNPPSTIAGSVGYTVRKIHPVNGGQRTILNLATFTDPSASSPNKWQKKFTPGLRINPPSSSPTYPSYQGGLMGLAIHPEFQTNPAKKFVYLAYGHHYITPTTTSPLVTNFNGETVQGNVFVTWLVRFTYANGQLTQPVAICDTIRGSNDHNSGRLIIRPEGGTNYLYYAVGDMGAGQFANINRIIKAQWLNSYEGKILRFNLEEDGDAAQDSTNYNRWIPNSNPYNATLGVQSAIWAVGMRNNQGFAYDTINGTPRFYGSSHGPFSDDEVNLLVQTGNYGHPQVIGYTDGNYNNAKAGPSSSSLPLIVNESNNADTTTNYQEPVYSNYAAPAGNTSTQWSIQYIYTNQFYSGGPTSGNAQNRNEHWASEGYSGLGLYTKPVIPGWKNSLLLGSLKWGRVVRMKLNSDGTSVVPTNGGDTVSYFGSTNRFRDVAVSPDGKTIFVVMDRSSTTSGPSANSPIVPACAGCVQRYEFIGYQSDGNGKSRIPGAIAISNGSAGSFTDGTTITINSANNNTNAWVPITDSEGNIIAEINAGGQDLGLISTRYYRNNSAIRISTGGQRYLDRNITITPEFQPSSPVDIRLYISNNEYNALDLDPSSGVSAITDLRILKNDDAASTAVQTATTLVTPDYVETHGSDKIVLQASIASFSSFYIGSSNLTLPVQLVSFRATLQQDRVWLQWDTEQEESLEGYVIERSDNGRDFAAIGEKAATGNGASRQVYTYADSSYLLVNSATIYYRLRIVDADGSIRYSSVVSVQLPSAKGLVRIVPNPVTGDGRVKWLIRSSEAGHANWMLADGQGRVWLRGRAEIVSGSNTVEIDASQLAAGVYYLHVAGPGFVEKLSMQKL